MADRAFSPTAPSYNELANIFGKNRIPLGLVGNTAEKGYFVSMVSINYDLDTIRDLSSVFYAACR